MTDEQMDFPIDEQLRGLADDYLAEAELPQAQVDQAFAQVSSKLAAGSSAAGISGVAKVGLGLGIVTSVFVAAMVLMRPPSPEPAPLAQAPLPPTPALQTTPATPTPDASADDVPAAPEASETPLIESDDPPSTEPTPAKKPARSASPKKAKAAAPKPKASTAKDELLLLERARKAMRSGRPESCLDLLDEHQAEYPKSRFARERDATRVAALCKAGRETKARKVAQTFVARYGRERASFRADDPCAK